MPILKPMLGLLALATAAAPCQDSLDEYRRRHEELVRQYVEASARDDVEAQREIHRRMTELREPAARPRPPEGPSPAAEASPIERPLPLAEAIEILVDALLGDPTRLREHPEVLDEAMEWERAELLRQYGSDRELVLAVLRSVDNVHELEDHVFELGGLEALGEEGRQLPLPRQWHLERDGSLIASPENPDDGPPRAGDEVLLDGPPWTAGIAPAGDGVAPGGRTWWLRMPERRVEPGVPIHEFPEPGDPGRSFDQHGNELSAEELEPRILDSDGNVLPPDDGSRFFDEDGRVVTEEEFFAGPGGAADTVTTRWAIRIGLGAGGAHAGVGATGLAASIRNRDSGAIGEGVFVGGGIGLGLQSPSEPASSDWVEFETSVLVGLDAFRNSTAVLTNVSIGLGLGYSVTWIRFPDLGTGAIYVGGFSHLIGEDASVNVGEFDLKAIRR